MNLNDSYFLCLDIRTNCVHGIANHVQSGDIIKSEITTCNNFDTIFAIKSVVDDLEHKMGHSFDSGYVTGDFGESIFEQVQQNSGWNTEHLITNTDIQKQISNIKLPENFSAIHIIPFNYDTPNARNIKIPIGYTSTQLLSTFSVIFYRYDNIKNITSMMRRAHIKCNSIFDSQYLENMILRKKNENILFIDFDAKFSTVSLWTPKGPVMHTKIPIGMDNITIDITKKFDIDFYEAERIKKTVANLIPQEMDRFTPADSAYEFSRSDINDVVIPRIQEIVEQIQNISKPFISEYPTKKIIITGTGCDIKNIEKFLENIFYIPVQNCGNDAAVLALSEYIWSLEKNSRAIYKLKHQKYHDCIEKVSRFFTKKRRQKNKQFIPIMPSTLCFNMLSHNTYEMFNNANISIIHVDIMDGLYVNKITGSIPELKTIRANTKAHLHVHLMTENPMTWSSNAILNGADTIIVSTNTAGVRATIKNVHSTGKRIGVALNPESSVNILKPVLRELDEVMLMAVSPGSAGQKFDTNVLKKIKILNGTRKKYGLKFLISVDGGINPETAKMCWDAGADLLVSGSYIANSQDFAISVQELLKK